MASTEWTRQKVELWISQRSWYQKIALSNGLETTGWVDCGKRLALMQGAQIHGSSVLDIGCNSGYYCLWAKKQGANRVLGIDIDGERIAEGKTLAEIEGLNIEFNIRQMSELSELGQFDIVFCFAVLTEISDLLGNLAILKTVIGSKAYIELSLAKPLMYLSMSEFWLKSFLKKQYSRGILEIHPSKAGWMLSPSLKVIRQIFGQDFKVSYIGKGLRYDMICVVRIR
jgi:SAM-dependent methyltransferase